MGDLNEEVQNTDGEIVQDELASLKQRADRLGLDYHPSIGAKSLAAKIAAHLNDEAQPDTQSAPAPVAVAPVAAAPAVEIPDFSIPVPAIETENQKRMRQKLEANKLVRVMVSCKNPLKKEWEGELITVGNAVIGTLKKFVPFEVEWHIPQIMLDMLKERHYQTFVTRKTDTGQKVREGKMVKEFAIELLDPLTQDEIEELARRQAMAAGQTV